MTRSSKRRTRSCSTLGSLTSFRCVQYCTLVIHLIHYCTVLYSCFHVVAIPGVAHANINTAYTACMRTYMQCMLILILDCTRLQYYHASHVHQGTFFSVCTSQEYDVTRKWSTCTRAYSTTGALFSAVNPSLYARRFQSFMFSTFPPDQDPSLPQPRWARGAAAWPAPLNTSTYATTSTETSNCSNSNSNSSSSSSSSSKSKSSSWPGYDRGRPVAQKRGTGPGASDVANSEESLRVCF